MSADAQMDKQNVVYYIRCSSALKRKAFLTDAATWMNLEDIRLSEMSQS